MSAPTESRRSCSRTNEGRHRHRRGHGHRQGCGARSRRGWIRRCLCRAPRPHSVAYTATKHAITGLTRSTSLDGRAYDIACGQIDIGNAATDLTAKMPLGVLQANGQLAPEPTMDTADVGRAVVYMAGLPLDTNVQFMTLMATKMPWIGRG